MALSIKDLDVSKFTDALKRLYIDSTSRGMYEIKLQGGGEVPDILKGSFTSYQKADEWLYFHLLKKTTIPDNTEKQKNGTSKRSKNI